MFAYLRKQLARLLAVSVLVLPLAGQLIFGSTQALAAAPVPELVSLDDSGRMFPGGAGGGQLSDSGRYAAFDHGSYDETSGTYNVSTYVRDRTAGKTVMATLMPDGSPANVGG